MPAALSSTATTNHRILYLNEKGDRFRNAARTTAVAAAGIALIGALIATQSTRVDLNMVSPALAVTVGVSLSVIAVGFIFNAWSKSRQYVVHLEVWPKSHLAVARTAGIWQEHVNLLAWKDFRTAVMSDPEENPPTDTLIQVRLSTGQSLIFDHAHGVAPHGWACLSRFLTKCSLPEALVENEQREYIPFAPVADPA